MENNRMNNEGSWASNRVFKLFREKIINPLQKRFLAAIDKNDKVAQDEINRELEILAGQTEKYKDAMTLNNELKNGGNYSEALKHSFPHDVGIPATYILENIDAQDENMDVKYENGMLSLMIPVPTITDKFSKESASALAMTGSPLHREEQEQVITEDDLPSIDKMDINADDLYGIIEQNTKANRLKLWVNQQKLLAFKQGQETNGKGGTFDVNAFMSSFEQTLTNEPSGPASYDDIMSDNSSFYKDVIEGPLLDIPYSSLGLSPEEIKVYDVNGNDIIDDPTLNKDDKHRLFEAMRENVDLWKNTIKDWGAKKIAQMYEKGVSSGQTILDEEIAKDKPKKDPSKIYVG